MAKTQQAPTQTSTFTPAPQQTQLIDAIMPTLTSFAAKPPARWQGETVAGFNPTQQAGQSQVLGSVPTQQGLASNAATGLNNYTSGNIWDPAQNKNLQGAVDASVRPIWDNLYQKTLPGIRSDAISTGNFGGSRQGVSEGLATQGAQQAAGDTASKLVQQQYATNVDAQLKALGLVPSVQAAQVTPGLTTSGVGDVQQALQQAQLNSQISGFNFDQYAPYLMARDLLGAVPGIPGGTNTATGSVPQANPWGQALGGAATGASIGAAFGPVGAGAGAAGGAVLPFLFR